MIDHTLKSDMTGSRLDVITETGRRRCFSKDDKARIVEEALAPGAIVSDVARRHGLRPQQVSAWRRQGRQVSPAKADEQHFVPDVVDTPTVAVGPEHKARGSKVSPDSASIIVIEIDGITIRAGRRADAAMVAAIVHALKATR
jgi:transposase